MARYIDADELEKAIDDAQTSLQTNNDKMWEINKPYFKGLAWARALVIEQPTADVVEVKHGEWIKHKRNIPKMKEFHDKGMGLHMNVKSIFWTCSCCSQWGNAHDKYCCVCGAKMDGVRKEEK